MSKNKRFVSAVPLPIAAVALSMATLGNMLMLDIPQLRPILGAIAMILLGLILLKFIFVTEESCGRFKTARHLFCCCDIAHGPDGLSHIYHEISERNGNNDLVSCHLSSCISYLFLYLLSPSNF